MIVQIQRRWNGLYHVEEAKVEPNFFSRLGSYFYDIEKKLFVEPGKRSGTWRKKQTCPIHWCNVVASIQNHNGSMTEEEVRKSFEASDDTFTSTDHVEWTLQRNSYLFLMRIGEVPDGAKMHS